MPSSTNRPIIVSFEGIDGCGKSTQARMFVNRLRAEGRRSILVKEPGSTPTGERIRRLLLQGATPISPWCELFLYLASRAQLAADVLTDAALRGSVIVVDRYIDSTVAYQGYGRGLPVPFITEAHRIFLTDLMPSLTFLIDADPRTLRPVLDNKHRDRMERESLAFQRRVRQGYLAIAAAEPERVKRIPRMPLKKTALRIAEIWDTCLHDL